MLCVCEPWSIQRTLGHLDSLTKYVYRDPYNIATAILLELNIPSNTSGFAYLRTVLTMYCIDPEAVQARGLYACIIESSRQLLTIEQIEQAIRRAIRKGWKKKNSEPWNCYFSTPDDGIMEMPTSQEFICRIGCIMLLHINRGKGRT